VAVYFSWDVRSRRGTRVKRFTLQILVVLNLTLGVAVSAPPVIGTVTASGSFRLNGDTVVANGTLTEGAVLENGLGNLSVRLSGGARLSLGADSRGTLYRDHILLERGEAFLQHGLGFDVEALGLSIRPNGETTGRIGMLGTKGVRVAALTGSFRVMNARGILVAKVAAGSALAFEPQAPVAAPITHVTGTLTRQDGHFLLTDLVTHVKVDITGQDLSAHVGHVVQVSGTLNASATPAAGASEAIIAVQVQSVAVGSTGGGAVAAGTGGPGAGVGIGVTTVAILGGVAAAATLGGLAASGALHGQSQSTPADVPPGPPGAPPGRPPVTPPITPPGQPPGRPPVTPPGLSR
jgi:hypothetical protein